MTSPQWTFQVGQLPRSQVLDPQLELGDHPAQLLTSHAAAETDAPDMRRWLRLKPGAARTQPPLVAGMPEGHGQLSVEVRSRFSIPLLLVDGQAVSVGRGRTRLALAPGAHCVEVQSRLTSEPAIVDIEPGRHTEIEYFEDEEGTTSFFGHPPRSYQPIPGPRFQLKAWYAVGLMLALPLLIVAILARGSEALLTWSIIAAVYLPLLAYVPIRRRFRRRWEEAVSEQKKRITSPVRPYPWGETSRYGPVAMGHNSDDELPVPAVGGALILTMSATRQRSAKPNDDAGNTHLCTYPTAAPQVFIDGHAQPATWGTWWYPVSAGRHTVKVILDGVPPGITVNAVRDDHVEEETYECDVAAGETRKVNVTAVTRSQLDAANMTISFGRPRLSVYSDFLGIPTDLTRT